MATRADVARLAGVSEAAVSYAISGKRPISAETRERVFAAMRELDYRPNAMARGLAGGKSTIIALLFPTHERGVSNADLEYVLGAASAARPLGYHVLMFPTEDHDLNEVRTMHQSGLIDGVLLMEVRLEDERIGFLDAAGIPVGLIGRAAQDTPPLAYSDRNFDEAVDIAVEHLTELGHRHLGLLNGSPHVHESRFGATIRAERAFVTATNARGLDARVFYCESTVEAGRRLMMEELVREPTISGLVTMNIEATLGVLAAAGEGGRRIPDELSVVSIDTSNSFAAATSPALTTVSPPAEQIGATAARQLINRIGELGLPEEDPLWAGTLVLRGSTARLPSRSEEVAEG
ncbi:LacI family DNA-binding transcriptional regulator [Agromyces sp. Soil535]|uniref:LacI family DNA-binding transcriptional regulator n=1 Tax=Agromyces sp. Soil535 TaxID=1736390 RepID=UPI0006F769B9|nr:LacI family DNA-binding transcriptional regulator [Agromyces sp. Soil535]KRE31381.1 hypothetical protein ASG80_02725 [Agromyces sp. Soil535]